MNKRDKKGEENMSSQSIKLRMVSLLALLFFATAATAAEKTSATDAVKGAVKDPKGAAQKAISQQVRKE